MLKWLMLTQVASKLVGMLLNIILVRRIGPQIFAISNKLDLASGFCLGIARETMRMALMRQTRREGESFVFWKHKLMKMSILTGMLGAVFGVVTVPLFSNVLRVDGVKWYGMAARNYCLSAAVDMLAEPMIIYFMHHDLIKVRLIGETLFAVTKSVILCLVSLREPITFEDFVYFLGASQLGLTVLLFSMYLAFFAFNERVNVEPKIRLNIPSLYHAKIDQHEQDLVLAVYKQSLTRFVMAQADGIVMSWLSPLSLFEQGVYALAANYVSLFPRIIQAPLEENGFMLFSKNIDKAAYSYYQTVVKFDVIIGLLLVLFVTQYTATFARLLTKDVQTAALLTRVLSAACFLLPIMSISGISESFMNATVGPLGMSRIRNVNTLLSLFNVLLCYFMASRFGAVGLVFAGIVTFGVRALLAGGYVFMRPNRHKQLDCNVRSGLITRLGVIAGVCALFGAYYGFGSKYHLTCGFASLPLAIYSVYSLEPSVVRLFVQ